MSYIVDKWWHLECRYWKLGTDKKFIQDNLSTSMSADNARPRKQWVTILYSRRQKTFSKRFKRERFSFGVCNISENFM